ncbi:helix-turn-helix domain-containing protein [Actinomyces wuliandei]|uniref:helix-turn-helix domain-containing protein n=1 Tax=Actinomyces wuliandei TaxID=2057743 RepID=UPI0035313CCA
MLLSAADVVREYPNVGLTRNTLWRWAREGLLACVRYPSGRVRFRREDIEALLEPQRAEPQSDAATSSASVGRPGSAEDAAALPGQGALL